MRSQGRVCSAKRSHPVYDSKYGAIPFLMNRYAYTCQCLQQWDAQFPARKSLPKTKRLALASKLGGLLLGSQTILIFYRCFTVTMSSLRHRENTLARPEIYSREQPSRSSLLYGRT